MSVAAIQSTYPEVAPTVGQFLSRRHRLLIGGKWVDAASGKTFTTYDPATEAPLGEVAAGDK